MPIHEPKNNLTGTYVLVIRLQKSKKISVGRLGVLSFQKGYYLYIGSAFGPGGLNARIQRHLRRTKKHHWHVDHLASEETIIDIWFSGLEDKQECGWANRLERITELKRPVTGFGSSDCSCRSHLFFSKRKPLFSPFRNLLGGGLECWPGRILNKKGGEAHRTGLNFTYITH